MRPDPVHGLPGAGVLAGRAELFRHIQVVGPCEGSQLVFVQDAAVGRAIDVDAPFCRARSVPAFCLVRCHTLADRIDHGDGCPEIIRVTEAAGPEAEPVIELGAGPAQELLLCDMATGDELFIQPEDGVAIAIDGFIAHAKASILAQFGQCIGTALVVIGSIRSARGWDV